MGEVQHELMLAGVHQAQHGFPELDGMLGVQPGFHRLDDDDRSFPTHLELHASPL